MTSMCIAAANYLIRKTNDFNNTKGRPYNDMIAMTCKRLQKLLYFAEVIFMQNNEGAPMLRDDFHAWPSGPVIPSVYNMFMQFQSGYMRPLEEGEHGSISLPMREALDEVFERTIYIDTVDLVFFSHVPGGPWEQVYNSKDIDHKQIVEKDKMFAFYRDQDWILNERIAI